MRTKYFPFVSSEVNTIQLHCKVDHEDYDSNFVFIVPRSFVEKKYKDLEDTPIDLDEFLEKEYTSEFSQRVFEDAVNERALIFVSYEDDDDYVRNLIGDDEYPITSVSIQDLPIEYQRKADAFSMTKLASKMAGAYCDGAFWSDLEILAEYCIEKD
jgi:hypothetical protein